MTTWQITDEWGDTWYYDNHSAEAAWARHARNHISEGSRIVSIEAVQDDES